MHGSGVAICGHYGHRMNPYMHVTTSAPSSTSASTCLQHQPVVLDMWQQTHPLGTKLYVTRSLWARRHRFAGRGLHNCREQVDKLGVLRANLGLSSGHVHREGGVGGEVEVRVFGPYAWCVMRGGLIG